MYRIGPALAFPGFFLIGMLAAADEPRLSDCVDEAISLLAKSPKRFQFIAYNADKGPSMGELTQDFAIDADAVLSILGPDGNVTSRVYTQGAQLVIETSRSSESEVWDIQVCERIGEGGSPIYVALARIDGSTGRELRRESTFGDDYEYGALRVGTPGDEASFRTTFSYFGKTIVKPGAGVE